VYSKPESRPAFLLSATISGICARALRAPSGPKVQTIEQPEVKLVVGTFRARLFGTDRRTAAGCGELLLERVARERLRAAAVMTDVPPMVKWTAAVIAGGGIAGLTLKMRFGKSGCSSLESVGSQRS
jgi:hypothetical protein